MCVRIKQEEHATNGETRMGWAREPKPSVGNDCNLTIMHSFQLIHEGTWGSALKVLSGSEIYIKMLP